MPPFALKNSGKCFVCKGCHQMALDAEGQEKAGSVKLQLPMDPENHVGGSKMGYNEKEHYVICACGAHIESAAHVVDENGRCTVCHYRKGSEVKTAVSGLTKHDEVLSTCIKEGVKAHYTDGAGKIYLSKAGIKEVDAAALSTPKSEHRHVGGEYAHSSSEHWIVCACGAELERGEHVFENGNTCAVCGYEKPSTWWIWLIVAAAALLIAALAVFLILKKKKKKRE